MIKRIYYGKKQYFYDDDKIIEHLNEKWVNGKCQFCGNDQWVADDRLYGLKEETESTSCTREEYDLIPLCVVICEKCGHTVLINAMTAGCLERDEG